VLPQLQDFPGHYIMVIEDTKLRKIIACATLIVVFALFFDDPFDLSDCFHFLCVFRKESLLIYVAKWVILKMLLSTIHIAARILVSGNQSP
jgi:hypothetical protein